MKISSKDINTIIKLRLVLSYGNLKTVRIPCNDYNRQYSFENPCEYREHPYSYTCHLLFINKTNKE